MHLREFWRRAFAAVPGQSGKSLVSWSGVNSATLVMVAAVIVFQLTAKSWRSSTRAGRAYEIPLDLLSIGGKVYTNTTIIFYNPAYAVVVFYDGLVRMAISNLPADFQTQFAYSPQIAAQFLAEEDLGKKK